MFYKPSQEILDKYAEILINFALNSGNGIKKGEVVFLQVPEIAKPLLISLRRAVLKAGAHPIINYLPDDITREYYEIANQEQLDFFPDKYLKGKVEQADHLVSIIADTNMHELEGIPSEKIMAKQKAMKPYIDWRNEKENNGKLTWTLALYATPAMAKEANLTLEEYWQEIIKACYLDEEDPIRKWKETLEEIERIKQKLDSLEIEKLNIKSNSTDLTIGIGKGRKWLGGSGRNIPSFELYISPDARITSGKVKFNKPLYRYGNLIEGIELEFKEGRIIKSSALKGQEVLREMISVKNADRVGEFSLTDKRFSKITKFMAETLFDENVGGEFGNFHIALGSAYKDSYPLDPSKLTEKEWETLGYNESVIHTDIVSTENRIVTAYLKDKTTKIIYKDGMFQI